MKIKTSELIGAQLDWAVAKAAGIEVWFADKWLVNDVQVQKLKVCDFEYWAPSTQWSQGGPLIERFKVHIAHDLGMVKAAVRVPTDRGMRQGGGSGATHLIAAMRAIVSAKLGDEIEVPEELQS